MSDFFALVMADDNRWHISIQDFHPDGSPVDLWNYFQGKWLNNPQPVPFEIQVEGFQVDYCRTAFSASVVSSRLADLIESIAPNDIQRIPAIVNGNQEGWEVLNVLNCIDCIDHQNSVIQYYPKDFSDRARAGKPRGIVRLVLDKSKIGSHHIFLPLDWKVRIIVSEALKQLIEANNITGLEFEPVT